MRVFIFHPDLGLGGAERLIVDLGLAGQTLGCSVTLFTGHHDISRAFRETLDGSVHVIVGGSFIPRSIFGTCVAFLTLMRMVWVALMAWLMVKTGLFPEPTFVVNDQVAGLNPLLTLLFGKVLFYAHFPDKLLCSNRCSSAKTMYRFVIDSCEDWGMSLNNLTIVSNSNYSAKILKRTFPWLKDQTLPILYPSVNCTEVEKKIRMAEALFQRNQCDMPPILQIFFRRVAPRPKLVVCISRYERKKRLELAVESFALYRQKHRVDENTLTLPVLVVAGGYDARIQECCDYYQELRELAESFGFHIGKDVIFLKSISDETKWVLLPQAAAVVYPPPEEHFGIVPIEAMCCGTPVVACNSGGPLESLKDMVTVSGSTTDISSVPGRFVSPHTSRLLPWANVPSYGA
ncbi:MAG: uncharacterized protein KVP18_000955 [Porospora cf. gigantea A]|uniref:uncharacterized protein n=1 Tax=Porospora cf. gigantea A TaxID=2853593 RepID=UPI00355A8C4E|nr:MAG: hypothetical protein KVP18_000955 [Porospora cf. gigantea A]